MLTKLVALSVVLSLAKMDRLPPAPIYTSEVAKYSVNTTLPDGPKFYMRDGQCRGSIEQEYLCGDFEPLGLKVLLSDKVAYPMIHIDESLANVRVVRKPNSSGHCKGVVDIRLKLLCQGYQGIRSQKRILMSE